MSGVIISFQLVHSQNLVPNSDFEFFSSCPNAASQLHLAVPWFEPSNLPGASDYFNACSSFMGVPNSLIGFQAAHSGDGYSGIYLYFDIVNDSREYLEVPLTLELEPGQCYQFSMFVNLADNSRYTTDAIGVYFSDTATTSLPYPGIMNVNPQVVNNAGNFPDSVTWMQMTGTYTAGGGEKFIVIGNFFPDATIAINTVNPSGVARAYCLIDDVSLTPCTGMNEPGGRAYLHLTPNPVEDYLNVIAGSDQLVLLELFDSFGKLIFKKEISGSCTLDTSWLSKGSYTYFLHSGQYETKTGKLIKL